MKSKCHNVVKDNLETAGLLIKGKVSNVHLASSPEDSRRQPVDLTRAVHDLVRLVCWVEVIVCAVKIRKRVRSWTIRTPASEQSIDVLTWLSLTVYTHGKYYIQRMNSKFKFIARSIAPFGLLISKSLSRKTCNLNTLL